MNRLPAVVALLLCAQCLSGCGQTGPLYLPGAPSEMRTPPAAEQPPAQPAEPSAAEEDEDDQG